MTPFWLERATADQTAWRYGAAAVRPPGSKSPPGFSRFYRAQAGTLPARSGLADAIDAAVVYLTGDGDTVPA